MTVDISGAVAAMGVFLILLILWLVRYVARRRRFPLVFEAKVEHVCDGDSIWVKGKYGRVKLRIAGMDAPETEQPRGRESERLLRSMIQGRTVMVRSVAADRYGRWVSIIKVKGLDVGLAMIEAGEAWAYGTYIRAVPKADRSRYVEAEARARRARKGLWAERNPEAPWLWRKRHRSILQRIVDFLWRIGRALRRMLGFR